MKTVICFFSGIGMPELLVLFIMAAPIIIIVTIIRAFRRKPIDNLPHTNTSNLSPLLRHAEKLKTLKELEEKGVISNDEFEAEKKQLLES